MNTPSQFFPSGGAGPRRGHFLPTAPSGFRSRKFQEQRMQNTVVDWLLDQKYADPGEEAYVIRRDLSVRRIEVSNGGRDPVLVKITTDSRTVLKNSELAYPTHFPEDIPVPRGQDYVIPSADQFPGASFVVYPGTSRFIGVNPIDGPLQYMHCLDPESGKPLGIPIELRHNAQIFVLREGNQGYFFQPFQSTGFSSKC